MKVKLAAILNIIGFLIVLNVMLFLTQTIVSFCAQFIVVDESITLIKIIAQFIAAFFTVKIFIGKNSFKTIGITKEKLNNKYIAITCFCSFLLSGSIIILIILRGGYTFKGFSWNNTETVDLITGLIIGLIDSIGITLAQEMIYRGYIFRKLDVYGKYKAVILTAIFYMINNTFDIGFNIRALLGLGLFSILLSFIYLRTGNLIYSMLFNTTWYFTNMYFFSTPLSQVETSGLILFNANHKYIINGGPFGITASIYFVIITSLIDIYMFSKIKDYDNRIF